MALIELRFSEIENMENQLKKMNSKLEDCYSCVRSRKNNLNMRVANKNDIDSRLESVLNQMRQQKESLESCCNFAIESVNTFVDVDNSIDSRPIIDIIKNMPNGMIMGATVLAGVEAADELLFLVNEKKKGVWDTVVESIKDKVGDTVEFYKDAYSVIKEEWNTEGSSLYIAKEYGKAAIKLVGGANMIAIGIAAIGSSAGLGTALGGVTIAYGAEKGFSALSDFKNIYEGNYEEIGKNNALENAAEKYGEKFGDIIGNEELGEALFEGVYKSGEIISEITTLSYSLDSIHQLPDINISGMVDEIPQAISGVGELLTTDITALDYQAKLFTYTVPNITAGVKAIDELDKIKDTTIDLTKNIVNVSSDIFISLVK